ncbi:hypothetical protein M3J09_002040 [Ascochyta lentis]
MMGDLSFGESFQCLENSAYHSWISALNRMTRQGAYFVVLGNMGFEWLVTLLFKTGRLTSRNKNSNLISEKLLRRMQIQRHDFIEALLGENENDQPLPMESLAANCSMLMLGGSETTSTLLSGVTFLLVTNLESYKKAVREVRDTFECLDEITLTSVSQLHFMHACIKEALRRYPPTAGSQPRLVPQGGAKVAGHFVPEKTVVSIYPFAASLSSANFKDPYQYRPDRHLDPSNTFDDMAASQPFSVGPRNCIGRNLAYAQSRLILARILFSFDIKLAESSRGWMNQKHHILWDKPPLNVYLSQVTRE